MKKFLTLLPLLLLMFALPSSASYAFHATVTIDHTKVSTNDQANFPVLFSGTFTYLKTVGNGGNVTSSSGFDIVFTSDAGCTTVLPFEIDTYDGTTGAVNFWIKVASVSHTVDTVFYICYDNASITTSQENKATLWSQYGSVWHMNTVSTTIPDSGAGGNTLTALFSGWVDAASLIGRGAQNPAGGMGMSGGSSSLPTGTNPVTISLWFKLSATSPESAFIGFGTASTRNAWRTGFWTSNHILTEAYGTGSSTIPWTADTTNWHYFTMVFPSGATNTTQIVDYIDGTALNMSSMASGTVNILSSTTQAGVLFNFNFGHMSGILDEMRVSTVDRPVDWITTEYNNQLNPGTFLTVGTPSGASSNTQIGGFLTGPMTIIPILMERK